MTAVNHLHLQNLDYKENSRLALCLFISGSVCYLNARYLNVLVSVLQLYNLSLADWFTQIKKKKKNIIAQEA